MKFILIPTPIGNLKDITLRALETIKNVDILLAEDTRVSKKLLHHYDIDKPLVSYHNFNEHKMIPSFIAKIKEGNTIGLLSDAGTPAISDPGFLIVRECIKEGIEVESLPGPTACITALVQSGLPCNQFVFEGFLPTKKGRKKKFLELTEEKRTMIFYESPNRLDKTIHDFLHYFGKERKISIHRELTKVYEEVIRGTLEEVAKNPKKWKGEIVLILEGKTT